MRSRQVEAVRTQEQLQILEAEQAATVQALAPLRRPFKAAVMEQLQAWAAQYQRKFCVLRAGPRCGKSTLAKSLHELFSWKPPYVQTLQAEIAANLRTFSLERHGYIAFDNLNSSQLILSQRAMMQSNCDVHTLGQSKTGIYSYPVYLHAVPIIFAVDHSAEWDAAEPWLSENMVLIELRACLGPWF